MPWKETTTMEQKIEFICEWRTGKYTITELCKNFKISRPTAYKLITRFEEKGFDGLRELSRKPKKSHPSKTDEKATYYANKVFRVPNIIAGYARTRKTLVCSEITNYYVNNKNWKQAVKWKKKRLYMYNMEVCGNGKYRRNMILYENIIDIYKKLNNIKLVKKYESKLEKYKNNESSQSKLY